MYELLPAIPLSGPASSTVSYRSVPIDPADSRGNEALVRLAEFGIACESFYARTDGDNWPYLETIPGAAKTIWVRRGVAERLVKANAFLKPFDVELLAVDGHRPIECQQGLWNYFMREANAMMQGASEADKIDYVRTYISNPSQFKRDDHTTWPVHTSGGAVDVLLRWVGTQDMVEMGALFDEIGAIAETAHYEEKFLKGEIPPNDARLMNRRLLYAAMIGAGFTNFRREFWHYDYGDQMYAFNSALPAAWYGYIDPPESAA